MEMMKVKKVSDKLTKFKGTYYNIPESEDYISVTEWESGEGFDICIGINNQFHLHRDELEGINYLVRKLDYDFDENV